MPVPGASELAEYNVHGVEMPDPSPISTRIAPPNDVSNAQLVQWAFERINAKDVESLRNFFWTADSTAHAVTESRAKIESATMLVEALSRERCGCLCCRFPVWPWPKRTLVTAEWRSARFAL